MKAENLLTVENTLKEYTLASGGIYTQMLKCVDWWKIRLGEQDILKRDNVFMLEEPARVVENRIGEAVDTYISYLLYKPVQYVNNGGDTPSEAIVNFNTLMELADKDSKDVDLYEEVLTCGVGYYLCQPNKSYNPNDKSSCPFKAEVLSGRRAFVIYDENTNVPCMCGIVMPKRVEIWTNNHYIDLGIDGKYSSSPNTMGVLPIVEYSLNQSKQGLVERGLALQNAINLLDSLCLDGVNQMVQFIIAVKNGKEIDKDARREIERAGGGWLFLTDLDENMKVNVEFLTNKIDKGGITDIKEDLLSAYYATLLLPNRKNGASDQNGTGVLLGSGFSQLIGNCKAITSRMRAPERAFIRLCLLYCHAYGVNDIESVGQVGIRWHFNLHDNIMLKAQAYKYFVDSGIAPAIALEWCEISNDPDGDIILSEDYQRDIGQDWTFFVGKKKGEN